MDFSQICKKLNELGSISGSNAKMEFIRNNDDSDLKEVYKWLYDNSRISGIAEKKFDKVIVESATLGNLSNVFSYLDSNHTGKDFDVLHIKSIMNSICEDDSEKEIFKKIVCKNLPLGIDSKTINKVFPKLIPTFDVCLCDKYYDKPELVDGRREFAVSTKVDGCVSSDTKIFTERGEVTIKNAIENKDKMVLSFNHIENKLEFKEIENSVVNESDKKWYEIKLSDGKVLKITENDKLYLPQLDAYRSVSDLRVGDVILTLD